MERPGTRLDGRGRRGPTRVTCLQLAVTGFVSHCRLPSAVFLDSLLTGLATQLQRHFRIVHQAQDRLSHLLRIARFDGKPTSCHLLGHSAHGGCYYRLFAQHRFQETEGESLGHARKDDDVPFIERRGSIGPKAGEGYRLFQP